MIDVTYGVTPWRYNEGWKILSGKRRGFAGEPGLGPRLGCNGAEKVI